MKKFLTLLLVALFCISFAQVANAASQNWYQNQIASIMAQIEKLQIALNEMISGKTEVAAVAATGVGSGWISRVNPSSGSSATSFKSIAYGNGVFVAVGDVGAIGPHNKEVMTSSDGVNWTYRSGSGQRQSPGAGSGWNDIAFGNGMFVAVGGLVSPGYVMTSPDGINWTYHNDDVISSEGLGWNSIAFGNGLFVAMGDDVYTSRAMRSSDGVTWTPIASLNGNAWSDNMFWAINNGTKGLSYRITYGNGLFVAISNSNGGLESILISSDGINWTSRTSPTDVSWEDITYANGLFVAVGRNAVMTSSDGVNWISRNPAMSTTASKDWRGVTYGNGIFVAVSNNGLWGDYNNIMTSPDGVNWTLRNGLVSNHGYWRSITHADNMFVAVSIDGQIMTFGNPTGGTLPPTVITPPAPLVPTAPISTAGNGQVTLSWTAPTGAAPSSYNVYNGTTLIPLATTGQTTGVRVSFPTITTATVSGLTNGTTYIFSVAGVNRTNSTTTVGDRLSFPTVIPVAPPINPPTVVVPPNPPATPIIAPVAGTDQVTLSWSAPTGVVNGYRVYSGSSNVPLPATGTGLRASFPTTTSARVYGLAPNVSHRFSVSAVRGSAESARLVFPEVRSVPLVPPSNFSTSASSGRITISWVNSSRGATSYRIYRSMSPGVKISATNRIATISGTATSYTSTGLTNYSLYYFRITAVNAQGTESAASLEISNMPR